MSLSFSEPVVTGEQALAPSEHDLGVMLLRGHPDPLRLLPPGWRCTGTGSMSDGWSGWIGCMWSRTTPFQPIGSPAAAARLGGRAR